MSSFRPNGDDPRWDSPPGSPVNPSSPVPLPQWFRQSRRHTGLLLGAKWRVSLVALGCIAMGCMLTSLLRTGDATYDDLADFPIGARPASIVPRPGIIGDDAVDDDGDRTSRGHEPSVSGALAQLHDAVKGKLQSWNPYTVQTSQTLPNSTQSCAGNTTTGHRAGEDVTDGIGEDERLGARIRIGKCTILFDGNSFWERAIRTHERHDREHGYRLHVLRQHLLDDVWSKPAYILSLLLRELAKAESERLEWLFWFDADTVILNPHIPIEIFLPPAGTEFDDVHLIYSNDWNGLNNGVFPIRVNQWSVRLFSAIAAYRHFRPDEHLLFRDQSAMDTVMHEAAFVRNIVQAPQRWFNAYQGEHNETLAPFQIRRGDFLVHFAGVPSREERMGYWLERAEQHLDDWEVPVKSTSYPQEVRDFWSEQRYVRQQRKETLTRARLRLQDLIADVDRRLSDYGERLSEEQRSGVQTQRDEAMRTLEDGASSDSGPIEEAARKLEEATQPLVLATAAAHKVLLEHAHEAIFAAERDLLEGGFGNGVRTPELERVSETVRVLKTLVITPQEHWNREDIVTATNAVTDARAKLQATPVAPTVPGSATSGEGDASATEHAASEPS